MRIVKTYKAPLVEVVKLVGRTVMQVVSPSGDIQGTPSGGTNDPGGFGAPVRW